MGSGSGSGGAGADEGAGASKLGSAAGGSSGPPQQPAEPAEPTLAVITTTHPTEGGRSKGAEGGGGLGAVTREVIKKKPKSGPGAWAERLRNKLTPPKHAAGGTDEKGRGGADEEDENYYSVSGDEGTEWKEVIGRGTLPLLYRALQLIFSVVAFAIYANTRPDIRVFGFALALNVLVCAWALYMTISDVLMVFDAWRPAVLTKRVLGTGVVGFIDMALAFGAFGVASGAAAVRGTWSSSESYRVDPDRVGCAARPCASLGEQMCRKLIAAIVFSFLTWLALLPSVMINTADRIEGIW